MNQFNFTNFTDSFNNSIFDTLTFNFALNNTDDFVRGIFEGVSEVPMTENKCYNSDLKEQHSKLVQNFYNVTEAFITQDNIVNSLNDLYNLILSLKELNSNCRISNLVKKLSNFTNSVGNVNFVYKLYNNQQDLRGNFYNVTSNIYISDYNKAGIACGKIIRILLEYSTK